MSIADDELAAYVMSDEEGATPTRSSSPSSCEGKAALVKRPWTSEEDDALVAAVRKYGACRWSMIATHLSTGRVGKQCRERWNNHLCPDVKKTEWSEEEDRAILEGVAVLGTRWCEIVKASPLQGRTDNAIKNRFYSLQRRMRSRQINGKSCSPLGKRSYEDGDELLVPGQRDRIVSVATELAFATDEQDRDRLIAELTSVLQEHHSPDDDQASELGTLDSPEVAAEMRQSLAQLRFERGYPSPATASPLIQTAAPEAQRSALRKALPLEDIDTSNHLDETAPLSVPTPPSVPFTPSARNADGSLSVSPTGATTLTPGGGTADSRFGMHEKENVRFSQTDCDAIGVSLGGRHAYKALIAPLCIPDALTSSPMKRMRTPSGSMRSSFDAPVPLSPFAVKWGIGKSGTEVPTFQALPAGGLRIEKADATAEMVVSSPMAELLNLSLFKDLFSPDAPSAADAAPRVVAPWAASVPTNNPKDVKVVPCGDSPHSPPTPAFTMNDAFLAEAPSAASGTEHRGTDEPTALPRLRRSSRGACSKPNVASTSVLVSTV